MISSRIAAIVIGPFVAYQAIVITGQLSGSGLSGSGQWKECNISSFSSFSLNCTTLAESSQQAECLGVEDDEFGNATDCVLLVMPASQAPTAAHTTPAVTTRPTAIPPTLATTSPQTTPQSTHQMSATTTAASNGNGNSGARAGDGYKFPWGKVIPSVLAIVLVFFILGIVLGVCFNRRLERDIHSQRQRELTAANQLAMQMDHLGGGFGGGATGKALDPEAGMDAMVVGNHDDEYRYGAGPRHAPSPSSSAIIVPTRPPPTAQKPASPAPPRSTTSLSVPNIHPASRLSWGESDEGVAPGSRRGSASRSITPTPSAAGTLQRRKFAKEVSSVRRKYLRSTEMELWSRGNHRTTSSAVTATSVVDGSVADGPGDDRKPHASQSSVFAEGDDYDDADGAAKGASIWGNKRALGSLRSIHSDVTAGSVDDEVHRQITDMDEDRHRQETDGSSALPPRRQSGLIQTCSAEQPVPAPRSEAGRMKVA